MFIQEPSVTVIKTGSFANWITAAAAVGTFVVVAKAAKKLVEVLTPKEEKEEDMFEKNKQFLADEDVINEDKFGYQKAWQKIQSAKEEPVIHPKPQPRAKVVQNVINLKDDVVRKSKRKIGKMVVRTIIKQVLKSK